MKTCSVHYKAHSCTVGLFFYKKLTPTENGENATQWNTSLIHALVYKLHTETERASLICEWVSNPVKRVLAAVSLCKNASGTPQHLVCMRWQLITDVPIWPPLWVCVHTHACTCRGVWVCVCLCTKRTVSPGTERDHSTLVTSCKTPGGWIRVRQHF